MAKATIQDRPKVGDFSWLFKVFCSGRFRKTQIVIYGLFMVYLWFIWDGLSVSLGSILGWVTKSIFLCCTVSSGF